jgi:hypothetical protein
MQEADLERLTFDHLPPLFFDRALRALFLAHKDAYDEVHANNAETEAANLLPYARRAKVEGYVRDAAERTGLRVDTVRPPKSGWNHIEVKAGPVVLTASAVPYPCGPVDPSEFRLTLAKPNEILLWEEPGDTPPDGTPLYVLLLHSRNVWVPHESKVNYSYLPGSAHIAFPVPELSEYVHSVNLFDRFPNVIESLMPQEWDTEVRVRYLYNARRVAVA